VEVERVVEEPLFVVEEPLFVVEEPRPTTDVLGEPEPEVVLVPELSPPSFLLTAATMRWRSEVDVRLVGPL